MEKYLPLLQKSPLFAAMVPGEILSVLHCVGAAEREFGAGEYILPAGSPTQAMGLLLSGSALAIQEDLWGERNIMGKIQPPGTFAEPFAATPGAVLNVSIVANAPVKVLFLSIQRILTVCSETCPQHALLIRNLVSVLAKKNLQLNDKITHMSKRRTREKLLSYLSSESLRQGSLEFDIPFDRQQLADYLGVDRSTMCNELSKMQRDRALGHVRGAFAPSKRRSAANRTLPLPPHCAASRHARSLTNPFESAVFFNSALTYIRGIMTPEIGRVAVLEEGEKQDVSD